MQVLFQGKQSTEEAAECLLNILSLFRERYGIENFRDVSLNFNMLDREGDVVDLIDPSTAEIFTSFEVNSAYEVQKDFNAHRPPLRLVVDNTNTRHCK